MGGNQGTRTVLLDRFWDSSYPLVAIKRLKKEYDEIEKAGAELPFTVHPLEVGQCLQVKVHYSP